MTNTTGPPAKPGSLIHKNATTLRDLAMGLPEAWEDFPWGHSAFKVRKKVFLFMCAGEEGLNISLKLTDSHFEAMLLPFVEPTGYGLGKSGWVSASFGTKDKPPMGILAQWIEESYRAVALKSLVKLLDQANVAGPGKSAPKSTAKRSAKKASAKKAARKKVSTTKLAAPKTTAKQASKKSAKAASKKKASRSR